MKTILLCLVLLCGGLYMSFITFNEIHAWFGIFLATLTVGGTGYITYNKLKNLE